MELTIDFDKKDLAELKRAVQLANRKLNQEIAIAIRLTTDRVHKKIVPKAIQSDVSAPQKVIKKQIVKGLKATKDRLNSSVTIKESRRLGLHQTKPAARQLKNKGVSFKTSHKKGTQRISDGFMRPKMGGLVAVRQGSNSYPLRFPKGPSPWGVFVVNRLGRPVKEEAERVLSIEIQKRVRAALVKAGLIG